MPIIFHGGIEIVTTTVNGIPVFHLHQHSAALPAVSCVGHAVEGLGEIQVYCVHVMTFRLLLCYYTDTGLRSESLTPAESLRRHSVRVTKQGLGLRS